LRQSLNAQTSETRGRNTLNKTPSLCAPAKVFECIFAKHCSSEHWCDNPHLNPSLICCCQQCQAGKESDYPIRCPYCVHFRVVRSQVRWHLDYRRDSLSKVTVHK
jgi:hypothetical protein